MDKEKMTEPVATMKRLSESRRPVAVIWFSFWKNEIICERAKPQKTDHMPSRHTHDAPIKML